MAEKMREIGVVKQVQIQRSSLKQGEKLSQVYNPTPLLVVDSLSISADGVFGLMADGGQIIDVHHAHHPESKNGGINGISVGFTSHYREMREQYGAHLVDGIAGENVLIEAEQHFALRDLGIRLAFEGSETGEIAFLDDLLVAAPCIEFSHFVNQANLVSAPLTPEQIKTTLQFLSQGRRGFYARPFQSGVIQAGDRVFAVEL